jgi:multidrug efflux pump subunit AcrA (membrane-fusion protein)
LLALFAAAAVVAVVVHVPETVSSPFVLVPLRGADPVRVALDGTVTQVRVVEGQSVKQGETMYVFSAAEQPADRQEMARLSGRLADLERMIALHRKQLALSETLTARYSKLLKQGYVSQEVAVNQQLEANKIALELEQAQSERDQARSDLEKLRNGMKARGSDPGDALAKGGGAVGIPAPCDGAIIRQQIKTGGTAVLAGETLCELACSAGRLQAELSIPPAEIGRLKAGQGVKLLYDAFPYQRYGVRYASLRWISPASVTIKDASAFRALADIADDAIQLKEGPRPLLAGMGGTAQVVVGSRSLISYAFAPIRGLRESLAEPPAPKTMERAP